MEIRYSHPDEGLFKTLRRLKEVGVRSDSRNGPILRFPEPVMLINEHPLNRVSTWDVRDANPFFHFMESLWMLAGMNEVKPMAFYNSGIAQYSDTGDTLRGTAYGWKWRSYFGYDQLEMAIERLTENPDDRRIVMTMWDPRDEWLNPESKDLSCNLQVIFGTRKGADGKVTLDMEVTNRSNDIVYGCLGSNVFHFSYLLEYVALRTGYKVGNYYQVAFNLHGYLDNQTFSDCYSVAGKAENFHVPEPVKNSYQKDLLFEGDPKVIQKFLLTGDPGEDPYLQAVAKPLYEAYRVFKLGSLGVKVDKGMRIRFAQEIAQQCLDHPLADAAFKWLGRRG